MQVRVCWVLCVSLCVCVCVFWGHLAAAFGLCLPRCLHSVAACLTLARGPGALFNLLSNGDRLQKSCSISGECNALPQPPSLLLRSTGFSVQKISVEQTFVPYRNFVAQEIGAYLPNSELGSACSCDTWVRVIQPAGRLPKEKVREREREVNEQERKLSQMSGVESGKSVS